MFLILSILSVVLLYGTEVLFWLALINLVLSHDYNYTTNYIVEIPSLMKFQKDYTELLEKGASPEELAALRVEPAQEEDYVWVPNFVRVMLFITQNLVLAFFVVGILYRLT